MSIEHRVKKSEVRDQRSEISGQETGDGRQEKEISVGERLSRPPRLSPPQADDGGQVAAIKV